jgi:hypothetical protein
MKVTLKDHEIYSYGLSLQVEVKGERYLVDVAYDFYDGYEVTFFSEQGIKIATPEWADKLEQKSDDSLGYILETSMGKRLEWVELEEVSA